MEDFHPIVWYQEFDGGSSYYTGMGHTKETWSDPLYLQQSWARLKLAMPYDPMTKKVKTVGVNPVLSKYEDGCWE